MDEKLFRLCDLEKIENPVLEENFEYLPCQKKFRMKPEDEISLDSIFSAMLAQIEPDEPEFQICSWDVTAKQMHNEKQAILFDEQLFISNLKDSNCKLCEQNKIFLERELKEIGEFCLNIEESYDGYVVLSRSKMTKLPGNTKCGHSLRGKYDNRFTLICEKRTEFDFVDNARIEKSLEARNKDDTQIVAKRETKINEESQKFKAVINIKGREETFVMDGGVMLLMRYLIVNNFTGEYHYYTMNLFGKIIRCIIRVEDERKKVRVFHRNFDNTICVVNTQYFDDVAQEVSETYYTANGKMVLHFWHGYNYLLHATKAPVKPPERVLPRFELMWKADKMMLKQFERQKKLNYTNAVKYMADHPEVSDYLHDYVLTLLKYKPTNVLEFTVKFFHNMKSRY